MTSLDKDTVSRNRIISEIGTNFFVEAGAGSGKTTMLVSRMVAMVEAGIPINKICAITFTKAAAGEFYDRFQKLLIERSNPDFVWEDKGYAGQLPAPTDETRARCAEALKNIDLCFMGTIDSFCGMILSEHPSEAGIPSDASIISNADAEAFYKQQYVKICNGAYGDDLKEKANAFKALHWNAEEVFVKGLLFFMDNRNVHFNYDEPKDSDLDKAFATEKSSLIEMLQFLKDHTELKYTYTTKKKESEKDSPNDAAWKSLDTINKSINRKWSLNPDKIIKQLGILKNLRIIPESMEHYAPTLSGVFESGGKKGRWYECTDYCKKIISGLNGYKYSLSVSFLNECVPSIEKAMREKGFMSYFDYLYYLRNMLKKDAEEDGKLIKYIYNRHSYFLIDEFQDTNPLQAEIFFYLSSENPVPQWSDCIPRHGSLFIVGDPKQSIYKFRGADVSSFLTVKDLFEKSGGSILPLSRNFRSTKTVCEYFNRVFSVMLPEDTENQSKFEEIPLPDDKPDEFQGVYKYTAYMGEELEAQHPNETAPVQMTKIIKQIVDNDAYLIRGEKDKHPRKLRYGDIMVITNIKKQLGPIALELDKEGIATRVEGSVPFDSNQALAEVFKVYKAVSNQDDAIALYGALTGRIIGLTNEHIIKYRTADGKVSLSSSFEKDSCKDETACLVAGKIEELRSLSYAAKRLSPAALFARIMDDYRVYETVEAENLEVVYYTLELLRNAEKSGLVVSLKDGADYIQSLINGESGEERCLSLTDSIDAVHLANLHKVKGLEAPVIILSAAESFSESVNNRIVHNVDGSEGYLFKLVNDNRKCFETDKYKSEVEAETKVQKAENQRLVYVAATRTRNALIICDCISSDKKEDKNTNAWEALIEADTPDIFEYDAELCEKEKPQEPTSEEPAAEDTVDASALYEEAGAKSALNDRTVEAGSYSIENPSRQQLASKISGGQDANIIENPPETTTDESKTEDKTSGNAEAHKVPTVLGEMVHKLMEILVSTRNAMDADGAIAEIINLYRKPETEPFEAVLKKALQDVAEKMRNGGYDQTNGLPKDILKELLSADEIYCEVPFCYAENSENGKTVWSGTMDVIYSKDSKWHIVDYKTNADGKNLDTKYQAQLVAYIKALKEMTGYDADAKTYHIDI